MRYLRPCTDGSVLLIDCTEEIEQLRTELTASKNIIEAKQKRIEELDHINSDMKKQLDWKSNDVCVLKDKINQLERIRTDLNINIVALRKAYFELKAEKETIKIIIKR